MGLAKKLITPVVAVGMAMNYSSLAQANHIDNEREVVEFLVDGFGSDLKTKDDGFAYTIIGYPNSRQMKRDFFTAFFTTDEFAHGDFTPDTKLYDTIDGAINSSEYKSASEIWSKEVEKVKSKLGIDLKFGIALVEIDLKRKDMVKVIAVNPNLTTYPLGDLKGNFVYNPISSL